MCTFRFGAIVASLALLLAASAASAAHWTGPEQLTNGDDAGVFAAGLLPGGGARIVAFGGPQLALSLRDAASGGPFGQPVPLAVGSHVFSVDLAGDGSGVALRTDPADGLEAVAFDGAGSPAAPYVLGQAAARNEDAAVDVSPAGAVAIAWTESTDQGVEVRAAFRAAGDGQFGPPQRAGYALSKQTLVDVGVGDDGQAVVIWQNNGFPSVLAAAVRLPATGLSPPRILSRTVSGASVAVGPEGDAIVAGGAANHTMRLAIRPAGAPSMPQLRTIDHAAQSYDTHVVAAGNGRLGAAWTVGRRRGNGPLTTRVYLGSAVAGLHRVGTVTRVGGDTKLAIDSAGDAVIAWEATEPTRPHDPTARARLALALRPAGGAFGPVTRIGGVALDSTPGHLVVAPGPIALAVFEVFEPAEADPQGHGYRREYATHLVP